MAYQQGIVKGDEASTIKLYGQRTAETSCKYFSEYIKPTANILDAGCGPGTITADLANLAPEGKTIGIDQSSGVIDQAKISFPASSHPNLSFAVGNVLALSEFADNSFDVVHAHQVLLHISEPVTALKELRRVCKPGGFVAVRDASPIHVLSLKPDVPSIRNYWARSMAVLPKLGGHPDAGRKLEAWAKEAGYGSDGEKVAASMTPIWQAGHLERCSGSPAEQAIQYGFATQEQLESWKQGWGRVGDCSGSRMGTGSW